MESGWDASATARGRRHRGTAVWGGPLMVTLLVGWRETYFNWKPRVFPWHIVLFFSGIFSSSHQSIDNWFWALYEFMSNQFPIPDPAKHASLGVLQCDTQISLSENRVLPLNPIVAYESGIYHIFTHTQKSFFVGFTSQLTSDINNHTDIITHNHT